MSSASTVTKTESQTRDELVNRPGWDYGPDVAEDSAASCSQQSAEAGSEQQSAQKDAINPDHYKVGGIETIDYMRAKATPEEFRGHLRLTAIKYLSRAGHKDELLNEYRKAAWYLDRLIKELEQ